MLPVLPLGNLLDILGASNKPRTNDTASSSARNASGLATLPGTTSPAQSDGSGVGDGLLGLDRVARAEVVEHLHRASPQRDQLRRTAALTHRLERLREYLLRLTAP